MAQSGLYACMMAKVIYNGVPLSYTNGCEKDASEKVLLELARGFIDYSVLRKPLPLLEYLT